MISTGRPFPGREVGEALHLGGWGGRVFLMEDSTVQCTAPSTPVGEPLKQVAGRSTWGGECEGDGVWERVLLGSKRA